MKNKIISISLLIGLVMLTRACGQITAKVEVVDDQGKPVEGATLGVGFWGYREGEGSYKTKQTNAQGKASLTGHPEASLALEVTKEGYYSYENDQLSRLENHSLEVILKRVVNPIPLFAKRLQLSSPKVGENLGYDLEIGDWVVPFGKGKSKDVLFEVHYTERARRDYDYHLIVSFPNELDGIQEFRGDVNSKLKSPHQAPSKGYQPKWEQKMQRRPGESRKGNRDPLRNYWLRVRSKVDDQGKLVSAHYVKIYGDFPDIKYYYNPTPNDRNLEFDPTKNLFTNLPYLEQVREL